MHLFPFHLPFHPSVIDSLHVTPVDAFVLSIENDLSAYTNEDGKMSQSKSGSVSSTSVSTTEGSDLAILDSAEGDLIIPTSSDIYRVFHSGKATWESLLATADDYPIGQWPIGSFDPYVMLMDIPRLPAELPRRKLCGKPLWHATRVTATSNQGDPDDTKYDLEPVYGRSFAINLETESPILCDLSTEAASCNFRNHSKTTSSLAILTLCWSYILCVSLLEMQGRGIKYTSHRLRTTKNGSSFNAINLDGATDELIRWLCAVLSPQLGWSTDRRHGLPPWAASIQQASLKQDITIIVSRPVSDVSAPPNAAKATELLIELCRLFGLAAEAKDGEHQYLPPYTAGLFAALMIPFYRFTGLRPRFMHPAPSRTDKDKLKKADERVIRGYVQDLPYFSTLSMHPPSVGSILWSMFWQPDIDCNLVSPWLASIIDVLDPVLEAKDLDRLLKTFALRRPRVAPWWVALFLLGDISALNWIRRYSTTLFEQYGSGTLSQPDPMISCWTGSKQSFLDCDSTGIYPDMKDRVPWADVLRRRFDLRLQDSGSAPLSWRPFGYIEKTAVELELWPYLETRCVRHYHSFTWYSSQGDPLPADFGFRRSTRRSVKAISDNLRLVSSTGPFQPPLHAMRLAPSKRSTLGMLVHQVKDATGGRHWPNAALPGALGHYSWLRDWEGLDEMEAEDTTAGHASEEYKAPWFLEKWMEHDDDLEGDCTT